MISPFIQKKKARFIAIEGGEGSGKSTLVNMFKELVGDKVAFTREPGGSPYAEEIRNVTIKNPLAKNAPPETTLCLMFAARYDNVANLVLPTLEKGISVVTDRFDGSSYAYQVGSQSSGKLEDLFWSLRKRLAMVPDMYIFIDVDPKEGLQRVNSRNKSLLQANKYDHFDDREIEFHEKVRRGYLDFFKKVPHIVIDANRSLELVKNDFVTEIGRIC